MIFYIINMNQFFSTIFLLIFFFFVVQFYDFRIPVLIVFFYLDCCITTIFPLFFLNCFLHYSEIFYFLLFDALHHLQVNKPPLLYPLPPPLSPPRRHLSLHHLHFYSNLYYNLNLIAQLPPLIILRPHQVKKKFHHHHHLHHLIILRPHQVKKKFHHHHHLHHLILNQHL